MRVSFLFIILLAISACGGGNRGENVSKGGEEGCNIQIRNGDLLFQTSTGSALSKAIDKVTQIAGTQGYVHVGMAVCSGSISNIKGEGQDRGAMYIIEAIDEGVCLTPLDSFLNRNAKTDIYRLQQEYQTLIPKAIEYSIKQLGKPYDSAYLPDTNKFYCSELIVEAFRYAANNGKQFFETQPMTFKVNGEFLPEWVEWYKQLGTAIPEGVQGSNPTGLSRDKRLNKAQINL